MNVLGSADRPHLETQRLKWLRREEAQMSRNVFVNAGRQQQAGKRDYLAAWGVLPTAEDEDDPDLNEIVVFGEPSRSWRMVKIFYQEGTQIVIESPANTIRRGAICWIASVIAHLRADWSTHSPASPQTAILDRVQRLETLGHSDEALDLLYDQIDGMLVAGKFSEVDRLLASADAQSLSLDLLLGLLTATLPARSKLASRADFVSRVEFSLKGRGQWEQNLLVGLES